MKKVILPALLISYLASGQLIGQPAAGSVIITEIMADPSPPVGLPPYEYIEILNRSPNHVSLTGLIFVSGTAEIALPDSVMMPGEYIIVCHINNAEVFRPYGRCIGLKQFPALTDGGRLLALTDGEEKLIHGLEYSDKWYGEQLKSDGGWSLEMIDTSSPFDGKNNWKASKSPAGGTPGRQNSHDQQHRDTYFRGIENVFPESDKRIELSFSETVPESEMTAGNILLNGEAVSSVTRKDILCRTFTVVPAGILERGRVYTLSMPAGFADFAGNSAARACFSFGIPGVPEHGDVQFNELLFNPAEGGSDFFEIVNVSGKVLDAASLYVASVSSSGDTSKLYRLAESGRCILPGGYLAITCDGEATEARYRSSDPDNIAEVPALPSMNNDAGHLLLLTIDLRIIDEVEYNESMHFQLLADYEGIALEKTGPGNNSMDHSSWHSAAGSSGWGTPGKPNSVYREYPAYSAEVSLSSTRLTPDSDGNDDFIAVHLVFPDQGYVVSVNVFDETGWLVKRAASNLLAGAEADIIWDGTSEDGTLVRPGIYVILVNAFNERGKTMRWKKACTVLR